MPRNVRNSWVDLVVDGREATIGTGPRSKDGRMTAQFYVRDDGCVERSVRVSTHVDHDGSLRLSVFDPDGNCIFDHRTQR